jgi:outer membrane protein assembly factor BamD (BamD/ComL family)
MKIKSSIKGTWLVLIISIMTSCAVTKDYQNVIMSNSIPVYENHLNKFPKSKYREIVKSRLRILNEEQDWNKATTTNTISGYYEYLGKYPGGLFLHDARYQIAKIEKQSEIIKAWNKAKSENSIEGYQTFMMLYPNSLYEYDAKIKINTIKEDSAWKTATDINTLDSYSIYLKNYPSGKYTSTAESKIEKIKEELYIIPIWNETVRKNTYQAYADFLRTHPQSSYAISAQDMMRKIEVQDWDRATTLNSIKAYKDYLNKYPAGSFVKIAEKKIIDLEVEEIFNKEHGKLPPMTKTSPGSSNKSSNEIEIYNNTTYNLTIRYSGKESTIIELYPYQRLTKILVNGTYKITASVNATNVTNYAGSEELIGGYYSVEYYIEHRRR